MEEMHGRRAYVAPAIAPISQETSKQRDSRTRGVQDSRHGRISGC
jgi:hypothetical protein